MQAEPVRPAVHRVNTAIGEVNDQGKMGAGSTFQLATSDKCVIEMHVSRATNVLGVGEILDRRDEQPEQERRRLRNVSGVS